MSTSSADYPAVPPAARRATLDELFRAKNVQPIRDVHELAVDGIFDSDEEVDEFIAAVREWRQSSIA